MLSWLLGCEADRKDDRAFYRSSDSQSGLSNPRETRTCAAWRHQSRSPGLGSLIRPSVQQIINAAHTDVWVHLSREIGEIKPVREGLSHRIL